MQVTKRPELASWHLYFKFSGGARIPIGADLLPGIHWRGNGGYVVGAVSIVNRPTDEVEKNLPFAPAPAPLLERVPQLRKNYAATG